MNVKEKDLVHKALGLAESVGSKVSEMEGTLEEIDKKAFPLFRLENVVSTSYSVDHNANALNILNVSGAGVLYGVCIASGTILAKQKYVKITLDDFSFYLDCSDVESDPLDLDYGGILCPVSSLLSCSGLRTPGYYWYSEFNLYNQSYSLDDIYMGDGYYLPIQAKDEPKRVILTPKALRFDKSLKIDAYTDAESAKLNVYVYYILKS